MKLPLVLDLVPEATAAVRAAGGDPEDAEVLLACAAGAAQQHDWPAVQELCAGALLLDPAHSRGWALYGLALAGEGRTTAAREALERALSLDERDAQSAVLLAELEQAEGLLEEAAARARGWAQALPRSALRERARRVLSRGKVAPT